MLIILSGCGDSNDSGPLINGHLRCSKLTHLHFMFVLKRFGHEKVNTHTDVQKYGTDSITWTTYAGDKKYSTFLESPLVW